MESLLQGLIFSTNEEIYPMNHSIDFRVNQFNGAGTVRIICLNLRYFNGFFLSFSMFFFLFKTWANKQGFIDKIYQEFAT